jgi:intracellular sulfur oxidation DsrE/DsrF family protein
MKSKILIVVFFLGLAGGIRAQQKGDSLITRIADSLVKNLSEKYSNSIRDSIVKELKDSIRWADLVKTASYPVIKNSKWSGAFPVSRVDEKVDPSIKYKLLFNMTLWSKDTTSRRQINDGLAEIGRVVNLHVAAGVPKENLELAIVVHGMAMNVYLKNEEYRRKFKMDNPNLDILKQFIAIKTNLLACGQAELFFNMPSDEFIPEVKTDYSAKVVLSTYQLKGYVLYNIEEEK